MARNASLPDPRKPDGPALPEAPSSHVRSDAGTAHPASEHLLDAALRQVERVRQRIGGEGDLTNSAEELLDVLSGSLRHAQTSTDALEAAGEEQRITLETLVDERERYRELWEGAPDGHLVTDLHGLVLDANRTAAEMFGVRLDALLRKPLVVFVPVEVRRPFRSLVNRAAAVTSRFHIFETPMFGRAHGRFPAIVWVARTTSFLTSTPELRWAIRNAATMEAKNERLDERTGERNRIEDVLRESDMRYRQLVEHATDIVYELDAHGRFTFCNAGAVKRTLGYDAAELYGLHLTEFVPPGYRDMVRNFSQQAEGSRTYFEFPMLTKDQRTVWLGQHGITVAVSGQPPVVRAICRDVSKKVDLVNELQTAGERMRNWSTHLQETIEAERARIAQDIHDELGAAITSIRMELAMTATAGAASKTNYRRRDIRLVRRIDAALDAIRRICSDLRPSLLDNMGLCAAIEWLCQDVQERTSMRCTTRLEGMAFELESRRSIALFRIVQEALTNVIRHAKATEVKISQECINNTIVITVADNGVGMNPLSHMGVRSFGIVGMQERARALGGRVTIERAEHGGTVVNIRMPMRAAALEGFKAHESTAGR